MLAMGARRGVTGHAGWPEGGVAACCCWLLCCLLVLRPDASRLLHSFVLLDWDVSSLCGAEEGVPECSSILLQAQDTRWHE